MTTPLSVTVEDLGGEFLFRSANVTLDADPARVPPYVVLDLSDPVLVKHTAEGIRRTHFGRPLRARITLYGVEVVREFHIVSVTVGARVGFRLQRIETVAKEAGATSGGDAGVVRG